MDMDFQNSKGCHARVEKRMSWNESTGLKSFDALIFLNLFFFDAVSN